MHVSLSWITTVVDALRIEVASHVPRVADDCFCVQLIVTKLGEAATYRAAVREALRRLPVTHTAV